MNNPNEENLLLYDTRFIKQKEYWMSQLSGNPAVTDIGLANHLKNHKTGEKIGPIKKMEIVFHRDLNRRLIELGKNSPLSIYLILLTLLKTLIYRYTDNEDIIVISPLFKDKISQETINDTLFIRNSIQEDMTFKELLLNVRQSVLDAYANQDYPHDQLLEFLTNTQSEPGGGKLSTVECLLKNIHPERNTREFQKELSFSFIKEKQGAIKGYILYDLVFYNKCYLEKIAKHFIRIFEVVIKNIEIKISDISFLSQQEMRQLLFEFNDTQLDYPEGKTLQQLFEEQVKKSPDRIAVFGMELSAEESTKLTGSVMEVRGPNPRHPFIHISYNQFNQRANQLGVTLKEKGVKLGQMAAILANRTPGHLIAMMAILKSGGAYTIIDPDFPLARKQILLEDSGVAVLLIQKSLWGKNNSLQLLNGGGSVIFFDERSLYKGPDVNPTCINRPGDPAYLLYTSGTTGKPKGAIITHRNVNNLVWGLKERIYKKYNTLLKVALISPFMFDASVKQVFGSLLQGHGLYIILEEDRIDALRIINFFQKQKIDIADGTPTHIKMLTEVLEHRSEIIWIKHFIIGGEPLTKKIVESFFDKFKTSVPKITNVYGPTECCVDATSYEISSEELTSIDRIPIGKVMPNYLIYILGKNNCLKPLGVPGELCIGGHGVGKGYLKREKLTKIKFTVNPFLKNEKINNMMYHTGDMARWLPDGHIDYLGRMDQQVKIRGFRIELEEIESILKSHDDIKEALVTAKEDINGDTYLCAYYVSPKEQDILKLKRFLSKYLSDYMIPTHFTLIKNVPYAPNGKVDKKALPHLEIKSEEVYIPPANDVEKKLVEIWSRLLGIEKDTIGTKTNFFQLGGHSLNAIKLISQIYKEFDLEVPLVEIFNNPRIKDISKYILSYQVGKFIEEPYILFNKGNIQTLFAFPPGLGYGIAYQKFSTLFVNYSIYAFHFIEEENRLKRYTDLIKGISTGRPIVLIGYSAGGNLAFEVTKVLESEGYEVSLLILLDSNLKIQKELHAQSEFNKKLGTYVDAINEYLIPNGLEAIKNKAIKKVENYLKYFYNMQNVGTVKANIHLIANEDKEGKEGSEFLTSVSWKKLTKNSFEIYPGYGDHSAMLKERNIEKNAKILREILTHVEFNSYKIK